MRILKLRPSYQLKIDGPATISIERVWGKLVILSVDCAKDVDIKWGSRRKFAKDSATTVKKVKGDDTDVNL